MSRTRLRTFCLLSLCAVSATSCLSTPELRNVDEPGDSALVAYTAAKTDWLGCRTTTPSPSAMPTILRSALAQLETATTNDQGVPLFWHCKGRVLEELGQPEAATVAYAEAVRLCPEWAPGWHRLATMETARGRFDTAKTTIANYWRSVGNLAKGLPEDIVLLGVTLYATRNPALREAWADAPTGLRRTVEQIHEALIWDGHARSLRSGDLLALLRGQGHLGDFYLAYTESPEDALLQQDRLGKALRMAPNLFEARYWRAMLAWRSGRYDEAEQLLRSHYFGSVEGADEPRVRIVYLRACIDSWLTHTHDEPLRRRATRAVAHLHATGRSHAPVDDVILAAAEQALCPSDQREQVLQALREWQPEEERDRRIQRALLRQFDRIAVAQPGDQR